MSLVSFQRLDKNRLEQMKLQGQVRLLHSLSGSRITLQIVFF